MKKSGQIRWKLVRFRLSGPVWHLQIDVRERFSTKSGFSGENPKNLEKVDFGGRPYRPLFSGSKSSKPTESLGPRKPGFQKRPLAGKSDIFGFFALFRVFRRKSDFFGFSHFSLLLKGPQALKFEKLPILSRFGSYFHANTPVFYIP